MSDFHRHLQAARGYLDLGMALDAHEEIEDIEPELRIRTEVLILRVDIFEALGKWDLMETIARQLCRRQPDDPQWFISLGYATRRSVGVQEALAVLATVADRFPEEALILHNLACYAAQLGHLDSARARLAEAIKPDSACQEMALADPELAALHDQIRRSTLDRES